MAVWLFSLLAAAALASPCDPHLTPFDSRRLEHLHQLRQDLIAHRERKDVDHQSITWDRLAGLAAQIKEMK